MVFIFTPNQIFIFPTIVKYVLAIISIVLALSSVIFLIIMGNMAEKHVMPKSQNILFLSASILPGAILRAVFGTLLANAFEFIPVAGIYIGYGMFVHAQNSATGVVITELAGHYADRGFEARRIV